MDTFKIKAIVTAVQHQSLSRAAEEFSYTPAAFSHMIAAFEKDGTLYSGSSITKKDLFFLFPVI